MSTQQPTTAGTALTRVRENTTTIADLIVELYNRNDLTPEEREVLQEAVVAVEALDHHTRNLERTIDTDVVIEDEHTRLMELVIVYEIDPCPACGQRLVVLEASEHRARGDYQTPPQHRARTGHRRDPPTPDVLEAARELIDAGDAASVDDAIAQAHDALPGHARVDADSETTHP